MKPGNPDFITVNPKNGKLTEKKCDIMSLGYFLSLLGDIQLKHESGCSPWINGYAEMAENNDLETFDRNNERDLLQVVIIDYDPELFIGRAETTKWKDSYWNVVD